MTLSVFDLFFFANFDHRTIVYFVSDFTRFLLVFFLFSEWAWTTYVVLFCLAVGISPPNFVR